MPPIAPRRPSLAGWLFAGAWIALQTISAQVPDISRFDPLGVTTNGTATLTIRGERLAPGSALWSTLPLQMISAGKTDSPGQLSVQLAIGPDTGTGIGAWRLAGSNGISALQLILVDTLATTTASPTNQNLAAAQLLQPPIAVDSQCDDLGSRFFQIELRRRQRVFLDVVAHRLGSPLDPFVRVLDVRGRELASADDSPGCGADSQLVFEAPERGRYFIQVRDTRHDGGERYRFRLRLDDVEAPPLRFLPPAFAIPGAPRSPVVHSARSAGGASIARSPEAITPPLWIRGRFEFPRDRHVFTFPAQAGESWRFRGRTRSLGSPCDLYLRLEKSDGAKLSEVNATGADEGSLTHKFSEAGPVRLVVEELNRGGGPGFDFELEISQDTPGFVLLTEKNSVTAVPGREFELKVNCARQGYDGPITLALAGVGDGFSWTNHVIAAKQTNTTMKITIPSTLMLAAWRDFAVIGSATNGEQVVEARASTMPALRTQFPAMLHPPRELDGLLTLGVRAE